jgi:hypothetical protein
MMTPVASRVQGGSQSGGSDSVELLGAGEALACGPGGWRREGGPRFVTTCEPTGAVLTAAAAGAAIPAS